MMMALLIFLGVPFALYFIYAAVLMPLYLIYSLIVSALSGGQRLYYKGERIGWLRRVPGAGTDIRHD